MGREERARIRLLVLDVDGTLTDGRLYIGNDGELCKAFHVRDGCGIRDILPEYGVRTAVLTARESRITEHRCRELGISDVLQGYRDKREGIAALAEKYGCIAGADGKYREIAYMGDDLLDLPCAKLCAVSACPSDAARRMREQASYVCRKKGGRGAVREFIEWLVRGRKKGGGER